jgi:hypothetical protein
MREASVEGRLESSGTPLWRANDLADIWNSKHLYIINVHPDSMFDTAQTFFRVPPILKEAGISPIPG